MFDQNEKTEEETLAGTDAVHSEGIKDVTKQIKNFLFVVGFNTILEQLNFQHLETWYR